MQLPLNFTEKLAEYPNYLKLLIAAIFTFSVANGLSTALFIQY